MINKDWKILLPFIIIPSLFFGLGAGFGLISENQVTSLVAIGFAGFILGWLVRHYSKNI